MLKDALMDTQRNARLFRNGRSQAVRIPREFEFSEKEVVMRKVGNKLILEPAKKKGNRLLELLATLEPIDEEFPDIDDPIAVNDDIKF
jgi:antitoxin VapB